MAITNQERVGKALELLKAGLAHLSSARSKTKSRPVAYTWTRSGALSMIRT